MKSQLPSEYAMLAVGLAIALIFGSAWFQSYCRRRRLRGSQVHRLFLRAYYGLSIAAVAGAVYIAANAVMEVSNQSFLTQGYRVLICAFWVGWVLSIVRETLRKTKACAAANSPGELEDLKIEEAIAQLNPLRAAASLSIMGTFLVTFFGIIPLASLCLGKNYGMNYTFMIGWLGWFTGLSLILLRVAAGRAGRGALTVLVSALGIAALLLAALSEHRFGAVVLFVIGLAGGGAFANIYLNVQAGAFAAETSMGGRVCALFRILPRAEWLERKTRTDQRFLHARSVAARKSEAEEGDPEVRCARIRGGQIA